MDSYGAGNTNENEKKMMMMALYNVVFLLEGIILPVMRITQLRIYEYKQQFLVNTIVLVYFLASLWNITWTKVLKALQHSFLSFC